MPSSQPPLHITGPLFQALGLMVNGIPITISNHGFGYESEGINSGKKKPRLAGLEGGGRLDRFGEVAVGDERLDVRLWRPSAEVKAIVVLGLAKRSDSLVFGELGTAH